MANYNFNLRDRNSKKATPLNLVVRWPGLKSPIRFYTRERIHPDYWNYDTQRAKNTKKFPEHPEFNQRLDNIEATAKNLFRQYQNDNDHNAPSPTEYKKLLEEAIKETKSGIPTTLFEFTEYFIEQTKKKLQTEKRVDSRSDISGSYSQTLMCLKDFAKDKNKRVDFDTMDNDFYSDFVEYLETFKTVTNKRGKKIKKYGFSANTIGKHVKNLKRILNEAASPEMNVNKFTNYKKFKVIKEDTDSIYLNEDELQSMYDLDLSKSPKLERVRDLFLVGAWTGLRFSDFTNIRAKYIQGEFIHIPTKKTVHKVVIPIHWTVKAIMDKYKDKYDNSLPPAISNTKMNDYLKDVGAELDELKKIESIVYTKAGKTIHVKKQKWELLTTHTARRSFATNMYLRGIPVITIMAITGHKTEKAFLRYIKVTPDEHAKIMMKNWQEQNKLRVV